MAKNTEKATRKSKGSKFRPGKGLRSAALPKKPGRAKTPVKKASGKTSETAKLATAAKPATPAKPAMAAAGVPAGIGPISRGSGMRVPEPGKKFVELFRAKTPDAKIWDTLFAKEFASVEGFGANMQFAGRAAVEAKNAEWSKTHVINGWTMDGPYCGSTGFSVRFKMDVTDTAANKQILMEEVAFYTVSNGKVVREEFMYLM